MEPAQGSKLFNNLSSSQHCLCHLLPPKHTGPYNFRNNMGCHISEQISLDILIFLPCAVNLFILQKHNFPLINNIRFYASTLYFYYSFRLHIVNILIKFYISFVNNYTIQLFSCNIITQLTIYLSMHKQNNESLCSITNAISVFKTFYNFIKPFTVTVGNLQ